MYYGPHGGVVVIGTPSYYYGNWYYYDPYHHHHHYPNLSDRFLDFHEDHPDLGGFSENVSSWLEENRDKMPEGWLQDDGRRAERLAEFGRFEGELADRVRANPDRQIGREQFMRENADKFSGLQKPGLRASCRPPRPRPGNGSPARASSEPARCRCSVPTTLSGSEKPATTTAASGAGRAVAVPGGGRTGGGRMGGGCRR